MNLDLDNNVAIVSGASRGIGRAIAQALSAEGMRLVLAARSRDLLEEVAKSLTTPCLVQAAYLNGAVIDIDGGATRTL